MAMQLHRMYLLLLLLLLLLLINQILERPFIIMYEVDIFRGLGDHNNYVIHIFIVSIKLINVFFCKRP